MIVKIASFVVLCLIFVSQFVPTAYTDVKFVLLLIGCSAVVVALVKGELYILQWQIIGILAFVSIAILYSLYGLVLGNPGSIRVLSIWLLWPVVYLLFTSLLQHKKSFKVLSNCFIVALICVTIYSFFYLGWSVGLIPGFLYFELDQGQGFGLYDGYVEYNLYSISSLIFLIPFCLHYFLERYKRNKKSISSVHIALVLAMITLAFLTGRRVILLLVLLIPIIILIVNIYLCNNIRLRFSLTTLFYFFMAASLLLFLMILMGFKFGSIVNMVLDGFDFSNSENIPASDRALQFYSLIDGWLSSSIFFGAGNGAVATIVRSEELRWAYELSYIYLLFSTGIFGVLFYFGWYLYGVMRLRDSILLRPDLVVYAGPMLTGSIVFCIASATNPYFQKFDYLWIVFLPFLISGWTRYQEDESLK